MSLSKLYSDEVRIKSGYNLDKMSCFKTQDKMGDKFLDKMTWTYLTDPENIIEAHIPGLVEDIYLSPIRSDGMDKVVLFFNDFVKGQKISEGNVGVLNFPKKK